MAGESELVEGALSGMLMIVQAQQKTSPVIPQIAWTSVARRRFA
jgi:hypothetical protein